MNYFRVLFDNYNYDVFAHDLKHAIEKVKAKYHMPNGFAIHEGELGNCKIGKKLY